MRLYVLDILPYTLHLQANPCLLSIIQFQVRPNSEHPSSPIPNPRLENPFTIFILLLSFDPTIILQRTPTPSSSPSSPPQSPFPYTNPIPSFPEAALSALFTPNHNEEISLLDDPHFSTHFSTPKASASRIVSGIRYEVRPPS